MTEKDIVTFCKTELGYKTVDVEISNSEFRTLIQQAIDCIAPWYSATRFVQAHGKVIDLSAHEPIMVRNIWNTKGLPRRYFFTC